jgi:hypothetical protein
MPPDGTPPIGRTGRRHTGEEDAMPEPEGKPPEGVVQPALPGITEPDPEKPIEEPPKTPPGYVPIRALQDERTKRQVLEGQFVEIQKTVAGLQGELKGRTTVAEPAKITVDDVLKAYQAGNITEVEKDRALYTLAKRDGKEETKAEIVQSFRAEHTTQTARQDIQEYMKAVPGLTDRSSQEFRDLSAEYQRLLEMGYPDAESTQRVACRSTFGPVERIKAKAVADRGTRDTATFTEQGTGRRPEDQGKADPLKNIPKVQIDHWARMGYSREQMIAEAPFYREHRRGARA